MTNSVQRIRKGILVCSVFVLTACTQAVSLESLSGTYEDRLLTLAFNSEIEQLEGHLYQEIPPIEGIKPDICDLSFLSSKQNNNKIILTAQAKGDPQTYNGVLNVNKDNLEIKFETSIFPCQRVFDLNGGEIFFRDPYLMGITEPMPLVKKLLQLDH